MQNAQELRQERTALDWTSIVYYAVMLIAFLIGLYGLFSLIWLAGDSVSQNAHVLGSLV